MRSFIDFYGYSSENLNCFNNRIIFSDLSLNLNNCFFSNFTSNNNGGVIFIQNNDINFNILCEDCIYSYCESNQGGAIFIQATKSNIILFKICAYKCVASINSNFGYFETSQNKRNELFFSSLLYCSYIEKIGNALTIYYNLGNIINNNINCSNCYSKFHAGISYSSSGNSTIIFLNFQNNHPQDCTISDSYYDMVNFNKINVIGNSSPLRYGIFYANSNGNIKIIDSVLKNNSNTLFYPNVGSISVKNCYISHINIGNYLDLGNNFTLTNNLNFPIFSTFLCEAFKTQIESKEIRFDLCNLKFILLNLIQNIETL